MNVSASVCRKKEGLFSAVTLRGGGCREGRHGWVVAHWKRKWREELSAYPPAISPSPPHSPEACRRVEHQRLTWRRRRNVFYFDKRAFVQWSVGNGGIGIALISSPQIIRTSRFTPPYPPIKRAHRATRTKKPSITLQSCRVIDGGISRVPLPLRPRRPFSFPLSVPRRRLETIFE